MATAYAPLKDIWTQERRPAPNLRNSDIGGQVRYKVAAPDYVGEFSMLVGQWRRDTEHRSSVREKMQDTSFQRMIAMGDKIIPLVIDELRSKQDFLFMALHVLTNQNPAHGAAPGDVRAIVAAWLDWADQQNVGRG